MLGFWHYFFSTLDPMSNLRFSTALPELELAAPWALWSAVYLLLPTLIVWLVYIAKPSAVRPTPPARPREGQPLVSVVVAGRNESATIGQCIEGALRCGYSNLEVIFVDDNSSDDSVAVARRAALRVTGSRHDTNRVRIFPSPRRNGKASSLNIGIRMARGEFIVIHDADSKIQYGIVPHWLLPFEDPRVGGVAANIRVDNSYVNLLTRMQEIEYSLKFTMARFIQSKFSIMAVISGMGGIFRGDVLRAMGGFDTGLGDDSDLSMMLIKQRFKLAYSNDAVVWTTVPETRHHLWNQRMRWRRNLIKIRISKHRDQFMLGRYGLAAAVMSIRLIFVLLVPATFVFAMIWALFTHGLLGTPEVIVTSYWVLLIIMLLRVLATHDIANTPKWINFPLITLYPFYILWLLFPMMYAEWMELIRVGAKHPYVPDHVWKEIPWW
jgi:cellulose synthase/poly-beta-1,6-N-acetylglucosamine synthase-like glycosyltransferase